MTPGIIFRPAREELPRPNISPNVPGGIGPAVVVGTSWTPWSGISIELVAAQRSSPALPGVARRRELTSELGGSGDSVVGGQT